jgi:hypothetical protein
MVSSISGGFSSSAMQQMQEKMFKKIDSSGDGKINKSEMETFKMSHQTNGSRGPSVDKIFDNLDSDSDGAITMQESESELAKLSQRIKSHVSSTAGDGSSIKDTLASALKSYTQYSADSYAQNASDTALLASSIYG